jgi:AraC family transcriptional regulator of adaptative response/methylated-DNA-[protein]-cysteine methyltransferase
MVAATERGLCFVQVGEPGAMQRALADEFPSASIAARPSRELQPLLSAALAAASAKALPPELPVDIRGTAFQWRVWRALTRIPRGETRSYSDIARAIGSPASVRAVARACATNPVALVVPCHRVVRRDGASGGYRWGNDVKAQLLTKERA